MEISQKTKNRPGNSTPGCVYIDTHTYTYVYIYVYGYALICMYMGVYICVCVCVYVYIFIYIYASKVTLKILQARLQQYMNCELQMYKLVLEKAEEPEIKSPTSTGSLKN